VTVDGVLQSDYDYDPNGNRLSRATPAATDTGVYDNQDRLVSYGIPRMSSTMPGT